MRRQLSLLDVSLLAALVAAVLYSLRATEADLDLWGHLAFGRLFWETGRFPYQDVFSFASTVPWVNYEWLTGVVFYPLYQAAGPAGLQLLRYGLGLGLLFCLYRAARQQGSSVLAVVLSLWLISSLYPFGFSPVRAQCFTYAFFALSLWLLERARLERRYGGLVWLVPLQVLWCNLHGGFLAGLGLVALYAAGEALSRRDFMPYLGVLLAAALATLANPYGLEYWYRLYEAVAMPRPYVTEWGSIFTAWRQGLYDTVIYLGQVVLLAGLLIGWSRRLALTPALVLGVTLALACRSIRHLPFFLMAVGVFLPPALDLFLEKLQPEGSWRRLQPWLRPGYALALVWLAVLGYGYALAERQPLALAVPEQPSRETKLYYPVGAVDYIEKNGLSGNLLVSLNWGQYALWRLYPRVLVAPDGRYDTAYDARVLAGALALEDAQPGWQQQLRAFNPDLVLVNTRSRLYPELRRHPEWRELYHDAGAALFGRAEAGKMTVFAR